MIKCPNCILRNHISQDLSSDFFFCLFFKSPEMRFMKYVIIGTKLGPLITINYVLCSLSVLFPGCFQPGGFSHLRSAIFHSCLSRSRLYGHDLWFFLQSAVFVAMASCISGVFWACMFYRCNLLPLERLHILGKFVKMAVVSFVYILWCHYI